MRVTTEIRTNCNLDLNGRPMPTSLTDHNQYWPTLLEGTPRIWFEGDGPRPYSVKSSYCSAADGPHRFFNEREARLGAGVLQ